MPEIRTRVATPEYRKGWEGIDWSNGKKWRDPVKKYEDHIRKLTGKDIEARSKLLFGDWECGVTGHPDDGHLAKAVKHVRHATKPHPCKCGHMTCRVCQWVDGMPREYWLALLECRAPSTQR